MGSSPAHTDAAAYYQTEIAGSTAQVVAAFRNRSCNVRTSVWYDLDGNNKLNKGDLTGTSAAIVVIDRGIFRSNLVAAPDVHMAIVP